MIFLFDNQTSCKKVRNKIHDIPVYIHEITLFIIKPRVKKVRNTIHDIPVDNQTSCKKSKKYNS